VAGGDSRKAESEKKMKVFYGRIVFEDGTTFRSEFKTEIEKVFSEKYGEHFSTKPYRDGTASEYFVGSVRCAILHNEYLPRENVPGHGFPEEYREIWRGIYHRIDAMKKAWKAINNGL
jgi:hypothetical protein